MANKSNFKKLLEMWRTGGGGTVGQKKFNFRRTQFGQKWPNSVNKKKTRHINIQMKSFQTKVLWILKFGEVRDLGAENQNLTIIYDFLIFVYEL